MRAVADKIGAEASKPYLEKARFPHPATKVGVQKGALVAEDRRPGLVMAVCP